MLSNSNPTQNTFANVVANHLADEPFHGCCPKKTHGPGQYAVLSLLEPNFERLSQELRRAIENNTEVPAGSLKSEVPLLLDSIWEHLRACLSFRDIHADTEPVTGTCTYVFFVPFNSWKISSSSPLAVDFRRRTISLADLKDLEATGKLLEGLFSEFYRPALLWWGSLGPEKKIHQRFNDSVENLFQRDEGGSWDLKDDDVSFWVLLDFVRLLGLYSTAPDPDQISELDLPNIEKMQRLAILAYSRLQELLQDLAESRCQPYLAILLREIGAVLTLHFFDSGRIDANPWFEWIRTVGLSVPRHWSLSAIELGIRHIARTGTMKNWFYQTFVRRSELALEHLRILFQESPVLIEILLGLQCPVHLDEGYMVDAQKLIDFLVLAGAQIPDVEPCQRGYPGIAGQAHIIEAVPKIRALFPGAIEEQRWILGFINYHQWVVMRTQLQQDSSYQAYEAFTMQARVLAARLSK